MTSAWVRRFNLFTGPFTYCYLDSLPGGLGERRRVSIRLSSVSGEGKAEPFSQASGWLRAHGLNGGLQRILMTWVAVSQAGLSLATHACQTYTA